MGVHFLKKIIGRSLWLAIPVLLSCDLGIEPIPLLPGESVVLEFNGPANFSYKLANGEVVQGSINGEEGFSLMNSFNDEVSNEYGLGYDEMVVGNFSIDESGVHLYIGPDRDLAIPNSSGIIPITQADIDNYYANAVVFLINRGGGKLDYEEPISFTGNFQGVTLKRRQLGCAGLDGAVILPEVQSDCSDTTATFITDQIKEKHYTKEELLLKLANHQFLPKNKGNTIAAFPQAIFRVPLKIFVKNTAVQTAGFDATQGKSGGKSEVGSGSESQSGPKACSVNKEGSPITPMGLLFQLGIWSLFIFKLRYRRK